MPVPISHEPHAAPKEVIGMSLHLYIADAKGDFSKAYVGQKYCDTASA